MELAQAMERRDTIDELAKRGRQPIDRSDGRVAAAHVLHEVDALDELHREEARPSSTMSS